MGLLESTISNTLDAASKIGKAALHSMFPDNFEYYMCSLELLSSEGSQIGFMSFVVMPNNISESVQPIQTQTKTKNGLVTLFNSSFTPVNISLQGTFGRKLRLIAGVINPKEQTQSSKWKNFLSGNVANVKGYSVGVKSGYGMTKVLKYILDMANSLDENNRPYLLLFNNYAFNTSYVVDVINYEFNQSTENNTLWFYQIQLKAVAPGNALTTTKNNNNSLLKNVASNAIAQGLTNVLNDAKRNNKLKYI